MLKGVLNTIVLIILLITTTGFTISRHYCGDSLVSVAIDREAEPCCEDDTGDCCHNESETFILEGDFMPVIFNYDFHELTVIELYLNNGLNLDLFANRANNTNNSIIASSPPPEDIHTILSRFQAYRL